MDALEDLSHTYIPQVYDFFVEGDTVYTVMDYIEGESLDRPLKRGTAYSQPQVIKWACELLEALSYLHSPIHGTPPRGFVHSDIKPANIMLTPHGSIRLIDFNIALALGEENVIGRSEGYASPEHYGLDFSTGSDTATVNNTTVLMSDIDETLLMHSESFSSSSKRIVIPDARSDIYSLGATLYHLLCGKRPARSATEATPLSDKEFSPQIVKIISKAMNPNPDLRYQSAEDMLFDFRHLRENDPRLLRWKRTRSAAIIVLAATFLAGGLSAFAGARMGEHAQRLEAESQRAEAVEQRAEADLQRAEAETQRIEADEQRVEAEKQRTEARLQEMHVLAANSADALRAGDKYSAIVFALDAVPNEDDAGIPHLPVAKKALADALGLYDLSDSFRPHRTVTLPSETLDFAIAPDGSSFAAMSLGTLSVFDTESGDLIAELPAVESGLADVLYLNNNAIVYASSDGLAMYSLASMSIQWTGKAATTIAISANGETIAAVNRDDGVAVVYDINGNVLHTVDFGDRSMRVAVNDRFGDPGGRIFRLNNDGTALAVSFSNGGLEIFNIAENDDSIEVFDESDYTHFEGGFFKEYFAFSATIRGESFFAVIDTAEFAVTISTTLSGRIGVTADEFGVYMSYNDINVSIDPQTANQTPLSYDPREQAAGDYCIDGSLNSPMVRISKRESHVDKEIFSYEPGYNHDEARLNSSGNRIMLFSAHSFRVYNTDGGIINETLIPSAEHVYDQQYRREGGESYLEVIYYDGTIHKYSGDDGTLMAVDSGDEADPSLFEEFTTDSLRITSPLHGKPIAYDIDTGDLIRELEEDAYLAYVTQVGEYVITEYISAEGERYGLLLDGKTCETLAHIPNLCDVIGNRLIVNIRASGSLRETRLYSAEEKIESARIMLSGAR